MSNKWAKPVSKENTEAKKDSRTPLRKARDIFAGLVIAISLPLSILLIYLLLSNAIEDSDSGISQSITHLREVVDALTDVTEDPLEPTLKEALDTLYEGPNSQSGIIQDIVNKLDYIDPECGLD